MAATTDAEGAFVLNGVANGRRTVEVAHPSYLRATVEVEVVGGAELTVPGVTLLAGDVDQDDRIGQLDAERVDAAWGAVPGDPRWSSELDITADGVVNIWDAVAIRFNWGARGPELAVGRDGAPVK